MDFVAHMNEIMQGRTCIVGMGNYYRGDDAVGLYIVDRLQHEVVSDRLRVINVEDVIESYVFTIAGMDCDNIVIVDAVQAESERGAVLFGRLDEMDGLGGALSTHKLSLVISGKIFEKYSKNTYLLGIVAGDTDFGVGISEEVRRSADTVKDLLLKSIQSSQKGAYQ
jgi:hydrogenase 3 maturation protease